MESNDRKQLIDLLLEITDVATPRGCKQILNDANLENFIPRIDFSGNTRIILSDIVDILFRHGRIDSNETALGRFLEAVKNYTGMEQQDFFDQLLTKYQKKSKESTICYSGARTEMDGSQQIYKLLNPSNFDLSKLISDCLNILEGKQGLVGLSVLYNQDPFLKYFSERLKTRIGKRYTNCKEPLTLDYRTSPDSAVKIIIRSEKLLQKGDVIYPIRLAVSNRKVSEEFWQKISAKFQHTIEHRLIIIMVSSENKFFPKGVIRLDPPQFTKADAHQWILDVASTLEWEEQHRNQWKQYMIEECSESQFLNIRLVYEHLERTIRLLQQNYTVEAFLEELYIYINNFN